MKDLSDGKAPGHPIMVIYSHPQFFAGIFAGRLIVKPRRLQEAAGLTVADLLLPYTTPGLGRRRAGVLVKFGLTLMWKLSYVVELYQQSSGISACRYRKLTRRGLVSRDMPTIARPSWAMDKAL